MVGLIEVNLTEILLFVQKQKLFCIIKLSVFAKD